MKKPEMIIFDYGHTLLHEPGWDTLRAQRELFKYIKKAPEGLSPESFDGIWKSLFEETCAVKSFDFEMDELRFLRFIFDLYGIELTISLREAETVFWNATAYGEKMPGAEEMLDYINARGIRSGVVSNMTFSKEALTERIDRLLPKNRFEFIITSSEYMFRKPSPRIFQIALRKAGLDAKDVWFCGDNVRSDVNGAGACGMYPVWYEDISMENPWRDRTGAVPEYDHLHIHEYSELISILENLE